MSKRRARDAKVEELRRRGVLHPRPERVSDEAFQQEGFFDPHDLVQVKYEMLRRVREEGSTVSAAAAAFGLSRPTFYHAQRAFGQLGLAGLLPRKRGPRSGHKVTSRVVAYLEREAARSERPSATELALRVEARFGVRVHPRTIERALVRRGKAPR